MRMYVIPAFAFVSLACVPQAFADSKSYCELFAKDFADGRTTDVDQWQKLYHGAYADCISQYTPVVPEAAPKKVTEAPVVEPPKAADVVAEKPAAKALEPGSDAWNDYCAAKYVSFNKEKGTYMSRTGRERRCVVTP